MTVRMLVAGFGNELRGDDGFGIEVAQRVARRLGDRGDVDVLEVGTGGLQLAQQLLDPYDRLVVVDAMTRGGEPGTLYVLELESVDEVRDVDLHLATPDRALSVAQALGALPAEVFLVGCEPQEVDELTMELTPGVAAAVEDAVEAVLRLLPPQGVHSAKEVADA